MRPIAIVLACALLAACAHAGVPRGDEIALPRALKSNERVMLQVELGRVTAGHEIVLRSLEGQLIGTVSPHGIGYGKPAGTYVVPVAPDILRVALKRGRLQLHILVERAGAAPRPASTNEVRNISAIILNEHYAP
jgi:hypothetical protein